MKIAISTLVITLGLTLAGQAAAGTTCNTIQNGNHIYKECFQTAAIHTWNTPKETTSHKGNPVVTTNRYGKVIGVIEQSGQASREKSGYVMANEWGSTTTTEVEHIVTDTSYSN